ncbi:MAG: serine hydrolase, partial [Ignavibacterium sp.]
YQPTQPIAFYRYQGYPAGDLKSTIEDFSHFLIAYVNEGTYKGRRILEANTVKEILEQQNPASGLCFIWNCTLGNWYGHSGGKTGTSAYVEYKRDKNVALMIVTNFRHPTVYPGNKTHALVRRIAGRYY